VLVVSWAYYKMKLVLLVVSDLLPIYSQIAIGAH
jgi:hypothetical protein